MSTVQEIERAIVGLSPEELDDLYAWMDEHIPQQIGVQLKSDLEAGRLDDSIRRALAEHAAGDLGLLHLSIERPDAAAECLQFASHDHSSF